MSDLYRVAELRALGREAEARKLLDALNTINVAFGGEPYAMPAPLHRHPGLITAPADKVSPDEFVRALRGEPLTEVVTRDLGDGRHRAAA